MDTPRRGKAEESDLVKEILNNYENAYLTIKAEGEFIQKLDIYK